MGNQPSVNGGENDSPMAQGGGGAGPPPQQTAYGAGAAYGSGGAVPPPGGSHHPHHQQPQHQQQQQQHSPFAQSLSYHDAPAYDTKQQQSSAAASQRQTQQQHMMGGRGGTASGTGTGDTSMPMDADGNTNNNSKLEGSWLDDDTVPTVFRWEHGGRQVYITGTFNGWSRQIPMHRSGNDFTYIHNLKRGKHAFKFIVDDEWRFAPDQPTVADIEGRINNFIDVTDFKPYTGDKDFEKEKAAAEYGGYATFVGGSDAEQQQQKQSNQQSQQQQQQEEHVGDAKDGAGRADVDGEVFSQNIPDFDEYTKEPPPLPPHLRHIILNKPPQLQDTAALPVPQHVALNHLYCTAIRDNMMVLGITQRYKTKFVTTVYYSPCASK